MTTYTYNKTPCAIDRLTQEIQQSNITIALDHITLFGAELNIIFKNSLSEGEQTSLDNIVAIHNGTPLPNNNAQPVIVTNALPAFAAKTVTVNGVTKNLYKRFTGIAQELTSGENTFTWTQSDYPWVKFLGIEIINGEVGDKCNLYVLDTATGTYSGHANYTLNQFAYNANIAPGFYQHESSYDADMWQNLQIKFVYTSVSAKTIYINFDMNEVK